MGGGGGGGALNHDTELAKCYNEQYSRTSIVSTCSGIPIPNTLAYETRIKMNSLIGVIFTRNHNGHTTKINILA